MSFCVIGKQLVLFLQGFVSGEQHAGTGKTDFLTAIQRKVDWRVQFKLSKKYNIQHLGLECMYIKNTYSSCSGWALCTDCRVVGARGDRSSRAGRPGDLQTRADRGAASAASCPRRQGARRFGGSSPCVPGRRDTRPLDIGQYR